MKQHSESLLITADWHLRNTVPECRTDDFITVQRNKLKEIDSIAGEYNSTIVFAGDLFHKWNPAFDTVIDFIQTMNHPFIGIPGNHDLQYHSMNNLGKSGISFVQAMGSLTLIPEDMPIQRRKGDFLHIISLGLNNLKTEYRRKDGLNMGVAHIMTWHGVLPFPGCQIPSATAILKALPQFDLIITGDNHSTFTAEYKGRVLINPGSITRQSADQIDHKPCVFIYDLEKKTFKKVFLSISDDAVSRMHIDVREERESRFDSFVQSLKEDNTHVDFMKNLDQTLQSNEVPEGIKKYINMAKEGTES